MDRKTIRVGILALVSGGVAILMLILIFLTGFHLIEEKPFFGPTFFYSAMIFLASFVLYLRKANILFV